METENWKDVRGFEGKYKVSDKGRVYSVPRLNSLGNKCGGKYLRPRKIGCKEGMTPYYQYCLCIEGINVNLKIHRLVATHFVDNPEDKPEVNHKDGNKQNNCADNLEWVTHQHNCLHRFTILKQTPVTGVKHGQSVLSEADVVEIYNRIKDLKREEFNAAALGREFGCDGRAILNIYLKQAWAWLTNTL